MKVVNRMVDLLRSREILWSPLASEMENVTTMGVP